MLVVDAAPSRRGVGRGLVPRTVRPPARCAVSFDRSARVVGANWKPGVEGRDDDDLHLEVVVGRSALPGVAEPGDPLLYEIEVLEVSAGSVRRVKVECELVGGARWHRAARHPGWAIGTEPGAVGEDAGPVPRLGRPELRRGVPGIAADVLHLDVRGDRLACGHGERRRGEREALADVLRGVERSRRSRRCRAPLAEVGRDGLIEVAAAAEDVVLHLPKLGPAVPGAAGPRVGLPAPRDLPGVEELTDDVDAAISARPADPDDRGNAVEVGIDGRHVGGARVEVDCEVDGAVAGLAGGCSLRVGCLRVGYALGVAGKGVVRAVFPDEDDVEPGGDEGLGLGGRDVLVCLGGDIPGGERVAVGCEGRRGGTGEGVVDAALAGDGRGARPDPFGRSGAAAPGGRETEQGGEGNDPGAASHGRASSSSDVPVRTHARTRTSRAIATSVTR